MPQQLGEGVLSWASVLDDQTREQAISTAGVAVVAGHVALMPDAHLGKGATVGSVIPTQEALIPSAVGVDIGCGVVASETRMREEQLPDNLNPVLRSWEREIPAGLGHWHADEDPQWQAFAAQHRLPEGIAADAKLRDKAGRQFGTLGSGNHFLELCADERGIVWVMLHSGSRGVGNILAQRHDKAAKQLMRRQRMTLPDRDLAYLLEGTPDFDAYVRDLQWAQAYAYGNRSRMMDVALRAVAAAAGWDDQPGGLEVQRINNHHNYARIERHGGADVWITRKGAISARAGELGVVPGSMGAGSYIVEGLGNPASYCSAAHGAGRAMSRRAARRRYTADDLEKAMAGRTWLLARARELIDEIPHAYKDLDAVMADQVDLVRAVHKLRTVVNYKGT